MEDFICIYCKNKYPISEASVSDIIPYALIGGKKLQLKNRVCQGCNELVNKNVEEDLIKKFESLRRRINPLTRRGKSLKDQYIIKFQSDRIEAETNPIKADSPQDILNRPLLFRDKDKKGIIIGPYDTIVDFATKKNKKEKVETVENVQDKLSIIETYPITIGDFFSDEMKTMVSKICYEWVVSVANYNEIMLPDYELISQAIYDNKVAEYNIVAILTNDNIAKALFEDLNVHHEKNENLIVPRKLIVGDYLLFFEIKNDKLYCYFVFMGMVLYRVLITTKNLPETKDILISRIYKYKGRTGELEIWMPHRDNWPLLSYHLDLDENYNHPEMYIEYLKTKLSEIIKFRVEEQ